MCLANWVEHLVRMTDTNDTNLRLMKIDKSRVIDYPKCYYGIEWDAENLYILVKYWACRGLAEILAHRKNDFKMEGGTRANE